MSQLKSFEELWQKRKIIFPNLEFGLDVEIQLKKLNRGLLSTIANRLMDLDQTSQIWKKDKSPYPSWTTFVTRESQSVITNDELCRERLFRSRDGNIKFYFQHARFGSNGRIHIRVEPDIRTIEIGYIGRHLPL